MDSLLIGCSSCRVGLHSWARSVWSVGSGECLRVLEAPRKDALWGVALSANGALLAAATSDTIW